MLSRIIQFVMSYPYVAFLIAIGLFNVSIRIAQKTKEQRARREAFNAMAREKQESLRTGRSGAGESSSSASQAQSKAQSQAGSLVQNQPKQTPESIRQERIEALRKERIEQLRALREKRAATTQTSNSHISQNHPNLPPIPVTASPKRTTQPQLQSQAQSQSPRQARPSSQSNQFNAPSVRRREQASAKQTLSPKIEAESRSILKSTDSAVDPYKIHAAGDSSQQQSTTKQAQDTSSARSLLRSKASVRQAMVLREVLDTPVGLRENDVLSGSLF